MLREERASATSVSSQPGDTLSPVEREAVGPFDQFADAVADFERTVLEQRPFEPDHYDVDYFASGWRADDNRYDLDTRREVEGRGPALVREVFEPARVLDVGCGPGFLM